jgi:hypothetical protein
MAASLPARSGAAAALALAACGAGHQPATFIGTVKGQAFAPADAQSAPATVSFSVGTAAVAAIVLSDAPGLCAKLTAGTEPRNGKALIFFLTDVNQVSLTGAVPDAPATYTVYDFSGGSLPPAHLAWVSFGVNDSNCVQNSSLSASGKSGSVTLSRLSTGAYAGSFDVTLDSGDHVSGTFDTSACPGLATWLGSSSHACG